MKVPWIVVLALFMLGGWLGVASGLYISGYAESVLRDVLDIGGSSAEVEVIPEVLEIDPVKDLGCDTPEVRAYLYVLDAYADGIKIQFTYKWEPMSEVEACVSRCIPVIEAWMNAEREAGNVEDHSE